MRQEKLPERGRGATSETAEIPPPSKINALRTTPDTTAAFDGGGMWGGVHLKPKELADIERDDL